MLFAKQSRRQSVVLQSVLCEDALRAKRMVMVWRSPLYKYGEQVLLLTKRLKAEKNIDQVIAVYVMQVWTA